MFAPVRSEQSEQTQKPAPCPATAPITVTTDDGGKTASCTVTVKAIPVVGIALSEEVLALMAGEEETLTATIAPDKASDKSVA